MEVTTNGMIVGVGLFSIILGIYLSLKSNNKADLKEVEEESSRRVRLEARIDAFEKEIGFVKLRLNDLKEDVEHKDFQVSAKIDKLDEKLDKLLQNLMDLHMK